MAVEREEVHGPFAVGGAVVTRIYRQANGQWFAEFDLNFRIGVGDGREVFVRKYVNVSASEQRGRKPSVVTQETKPEPPATSMDYGGVGQVGCEGDDGLLRIHRTNETCDVCSSQKASGQLCDCGEFCKASLELSFNPKCRRLAKGLPVNGS